MNYSNGFDLDIVLPILTQRVGWREENLIRSFESFHALCTEQNLRDVQPDSNISDSDFDDYKTQLKKDIIQRCLSSVFSKPEFIEQVLLHKRVPNQQRIYVTNTSNFVGLRFNIAADFGLSTWIKTVTLLFDSSISFNLYLFQDGNPTPLQTIPVTSVANKATVIDVTDILLSYAQTQSTVFYLGYKQSEIDALGAKAIREQIRWTDTIAFGAQCFTMKESDLPKFIPAFTYDSYGLNAEVHSFRDYTYQIKNDAQVFDEAIGLCMVYFLLEQIVSTTRSNVTERILKGSFEAIELKHYLYGSVPAMGVAKTTGLNDIINMKLSQIRDSFYPCGKAQTVNLVHEDKRYQLNNLARW